MPIIPFSRQITNPITKEKITVLQINLGKKCNLACTHCHVEASPKRTEELSPEICTQLIEIIHRFPQIKTVDLTGGAPEMNYGFKPLVEAAKSKNKEVIVRSNLTIFFVPEFTYLPEYFAQKKIRVIASLPCYLEKNVDKQRGAGVYKDSIEALKILNQLGYGRDPELIIDLVYNPDLPNNENFSLTPNQKQLEGDYQKYLAENFDIQFNHLLTITNLPIGRTKEYLQRKHWENIYLKFLAANYNPATLTNLMCRNELSIDRFGNVYDCDFNQMENIPAKTNDGQNLTISKLLEMNNLDLINCVQTANYCYGCTAGNGSSCGGALI